MPAVENLPLDARPWSSVTAAERIGAFLHDSTGMLTVVVEVATPAGLAWLGGCVPEDRAVRLVLGEAFIQTWAKEPTGEPRDATARFLNRATVGTWFWRRTPRENPSLSLWLTEGPPRQGLNATTQLNTACLHHHLDTVTGIDHSELDHLLVWIEDLLEGCPAKAEVFPPIWGSEKGRRPPQ